MHFIKKKRVVGCEPWTHFSFSDIFTSALHHEEWIQREENNSDQQPWILSHPNQRWNQPPVSLVVPPHHAKDHLSSSRGRLASSRANHQRRVSKGKLQCQNCDFMIIYLRYFALLITYVKFCYTKVILIKWLYYYMTILKINISNIEKIELC